MDYQYDYLLIGGGMTADSAVTGIREVDPRGSIGLIDMEGPTPYDRPPLSKNLWTGKPFDSIWRAAAAQNAYLHLGRRATSIDRDRRLVVDDFGRVYGYRRLLLAVGGRPRRLPQDAEGVIYFRTLRDYWWLHFAATLRERIVVIGGGFIGSELAAVLKGAKCPVTMIVPEDGLGARLFPPELSAFLNQYYRNKGVDVRTNASVQSVVKEGSRYRVRVTRAGRSRGETILADRVVAGIGLLPNLELARESGLAVEDGIVVDESLRTNDPDIFAAGDVAQFFSAAHGRSVRVEHEDNANMMGRAAGESMAGKAVRYIHQPSFYSDMFDLGYEAVGELDSRLQTVAEWEDPLRKGVVYYLREGRIVGVLLWNVWDRLPAARELIAKSREGASTELIGRLP